MSWIITGTEKNDPVGIENVSLLLHGDGANGSTTIVDSSPSPKTVTAFGNAQISTAQSRFGGSSIAFDGSGDYVQIGATNDFAFGASDFTVEGWCYLAVDITTGYPQLFSIAASDVMYINFRQSRSFALTDASTLFATSPAAAPLGEWFHFAVTRTLSTARVFLNGISGTPAACSKSFGAIGQTNTTVGALQLNGFIDDLRITKGVARYTSNFTPPTAPFPDF